MQKNAQTSFVDHRFRQTMEEQQFPEDEERHNESMENMGEEKKLSTPLEYVT